MICWHAYFPLTVPWQPLQRGVRQHFETMRHGVEQLQAHIDVGVQKLIFVPYEYRQDQVEIIAREIIPRLKR